MIWADCWRAPRTAGVREEQLDGVPCRTGPYTAASTWLGTKVQQMISANGDKNCDELQHMLAVLTCLSKHRQLVVIMEQIRDRDIQLVVVIMSSFVHKKSHPDIQLAAVIMV